MSFCQMDCSELHSIQGQDMYQLRELFSQGIVLHCYWTQIVSLFTRRWLGVWLWGLPTMDCRGLIPPFIWLPPR